MPQIRRMILGPGADLDDLRTAVGDTVRAMTSVSSSCE